MSARTTATIAILLAIAPGGFACLEPQRSNRPQGSPATGSNPPVTVQEPVVQTAKTLPIEPPKPTVDQSQRNNQNDPSSKTNKTGETISAAGQIISTGIGADGKRLFWKKNTDIPEAGNSTPEAVVQTILSKLRSAKPTWPKNILELDSSNPESQKLLEAFGTEPDKSDFKKLLAEITTERSKDAKGRLKIMVVLALSTPGWASEFSIWFTVVPSADGYKGVLFERKTQDGRSVLWFEPEGT